MAVFLNFVVKTAEVWLVLGGFFCVFGQSETICIFRSCNKFALVLQKNCTPFSANQNWVIFSCILLKTKVMHFKIENTPIKDKNGKKNFKRMLRFLFVDKRELFAMKLCFEEFNLVFFTADQSPWLVLSQPTQWGFWRNGVNGTFCTLWSRKVRFWKRIFVFVKFSSTFSTFWHRRDRKLQSALEIDFLPCAQPI